MSCWAVMISCWNELFDCLAEFRSNAWSIQKSNKNSRRQRPELFDCLVKTIRLSWFIQKRNKSSRRQRPVQTIHDDYFRPYQGLNKQFIYSEWIFIWQTRAWSVTVCWHCGCWRISVWHKIVDRSTWLFFPSKSKQANKDYQALKRQGRGRDRPPG